MKRFMLAAFAMTLIGCATSVPKIDATRLAEVTKGETRIADIVGRFGRPSVLLKNMDGTQTAAYMHAEGRSDAAALVPLMTALAGKADANVDSVIFYFDGKGVLSDYKTTQAKAAEPALTAAEKATPAPTNKPPSIAKKSSVGDSDPWKIQLHPSGYRENRP